MLALLPPRVHVEETPSGRVYSAALPLPEPARCVGDWLVRHAHERPDVTFLAERDADGAWERWSYGRVLAAVERVAASLLAQGARPHRPVMILSDNSVRTALLSLAAMHVGVPVSTVSSAYSLLSTSFGRLRELAAQLAPGVVYAEDLVRFGPALSALGVAAPFDLDAALATPPSTAARAAFAAVTPDTVAKVLFTSGSTGRPKGVVNTQRMLTANQESLAACWPFLADEPPVVVDWLPWSHTFGGNHNFFLVLRNGGTLYVDRGRPAPGLIETTLRNMADVAPTLWVNVPRGFDQAVGVLEADPALAGAVFARLSLVFYAAAALGPVTRARLERIAVSVGRPDLFFTSAWGSTETAPLATSAHFPTRTTGILGVPVPGVAIKLAPVADKLELRVRGPNVTLGYWEPGGAVVPVACDADGFLPTGDAGRLADPEVPEAGFVFGGRLSENFKLSSGTWVTVAPVRLGIVEAAAPLVLDAVIAGHDRAEIGALLFLTPAGAALAPAVLHERLAAAIATYNQDHPGTSERIARYRVLTEPLSLDEGEATDKGYTNQRRVLERRAAEVEGLFG
jgi:feruloyl-CoA synthase